MKPEVGSRSGAWGHGSLSVAGTEVKMVSWGQGPQRDSSRGNTLGGKESGRWDQLPFHLLDSDLAREAGLPVKTRRPPHLVSESRVMQNVCEHCQMRHLLSIESVVIPDRNNWQLCHTL